MDKRQHTIEWFKRQAKNLKKEHKITHTEALEILSKQAGYTNWIHCQRSLNERPVQEVKSAIVPVEMNFTNWLTKHKNRDSPLGDLASDMLAIKSGLLTTIHWKTLCGILSLSMFILM